MDPLEAVRWALVSDIPSSRQINMHRTRCVLVALASHVNRDGEAFPGTQTIADEIHSLTRRDVRNALDVLEAAGIITPTSTPTRGRSTVWRLNMAGHPAIRKAGHPANSDPAEMAGQLAGEMAGQLAGHPASKRSEEKNPPPPPVTSHLADHEREEEEVIDTTKAETLRALLEHGVDDPTEAEWLWQRVDADPDTRSPVHRVRTTWLHEARRAYRNRPRATSPTSLPWPAHAYVDDGSGLSCDDCPLPSHHPVHQEP